MLGTVSACIATRVCTITFACASMRTISVGIVVMDVFPQVPCNTPETVIKLRSNTQECLINFAPQEFISIPDKSVSQVCYHKSTTNDNKCL